MGLISDAAESRGDWARRQAHTEQEIAQVRTARRAQATSIGEGEFRVHSGAEIVVEGGGGITVRDDGRIRAKYANGQSGIVFGPVGVADQPGVPHGTGLYVWTEDGTPIWWVTQASDGRTELVTGTDDIPIQRIWHRVDEERHYVYESYTVQSFDGADIGIFSDGALTLFADGDGGLSVNGNGSIDADGDLDIDATGTAQITAGTVLQLLCDGQAALGGATGTFLQPESGAGVANMHIDTTTGQVTYVPSTARAKRDIQDLTVDTDMVLHLRPRTWLPGPGRRHCPPWLHDTHTDPAQCCAGETVAPPEDAPREVGFVAEELHDLGLADFVDYDEAGLPASIRYDRLTAALVPLLQQQQAQIAALAERVAALESGS